ncbi:MAG: GntR family transcriptional regulator [Planctomycetota bacterium]
MPPPSPPIVALPLREQVYEHLKRRLQAGTLAPGALLDQNALAAEMGISRTPLRDALLVLAAEGFVEILPRRGVRVAALTLDRIRDLYEIVGALEAAALRGAGGRIETAEIDRLDELNAARRAALVAGDFDTFYARNVEFHATWLALSPNEELTRAVRILRQRLYDFPRHRELVKEWEVASTGEHAEIIRLLRAGEVGAAADFLRDVHWSFAVQEPFIRRYYEDGRRPASDA